MDIISMLQKVYVDNKSIKDCWLLKQMIEILVMLLPKLGRFGLNSSECFAAFKFLKCLK